MKVGLQVYVGGDAVGAEFLVRIAEAVEDRGFHSIWVPEHVLMFPEIESAYPYAADGSFPFDTKALPPEPFTLLAFLAARTRRVRLATGICILPQRNPVYTAKQAADVDVLSGGRLDIGFGVGWLAQEFDALGVPFEHRGSRADEYLQVMRRLWCDEVSRFEGRFYDLPASHQSPKPLQKPHPPLFFGGESDAALRRIARHGQGWFSAGFRAEEMAAPLARLDALLAAEGRARAEIEIAVGPAGGKADLEMVKRYREAGVEQIVLALAGRNVDRFLARIDDMVEQVVLPAAVL